VHFRRKIHLCITPDFMPGDVEPGAQTHFLAYLKPRKGVWRDILASSFILKNVYVSE
jgi:hypothetical protein